MLPHEAKEAQILTIAPRGVLLRETIIDLIRQHYPQAAGRSIFWNLTAADISALTQQDFGQIALVARQSIPSGTERKTAYAVTDAKSFLNLQKYIHEALTARVPAEYAAFLSVSAAMEWLTSRR